jgi:glycosyltransferase involved in cell wall biosynthesis
MAHCQSCSREHRVGFIATRLAGTHGVSRATEKWRRIFEEQGLTCFYFAGELDRDPQRCYLVGEAHYQHPLIREINHHCFGSHQRNRTITRQIHQIKSRLKDHLYSYIEKYNIDLLVAENCLALPLNIPLAMALSELISETGLTTIAHHHDFFWERRQFMDNAIWEYLDMAFPPRIPSIHHVVLNATAGQQLSLRKGLSAIVIANGMDFENSPAPIDEYAADARQALGLEDHELLVLQPTRVVERKGLENAIEFVQRLGTKSKLVISNASGDEGYDYQKRVWEYSRQLGVETLLVTDIIDGRRGRTPDGRKIYAIEDIYAHADLVTYPSEMEGFGDAFLEAVYYRKPILVNTRSIYSTDFRPKGFAAIEIDGWVSRPAARLAKKVLRDEDFRTKMAEHNYNVALRHFSHGVVAHKLKALLTDCLSCRLDG